MDPTENINAWKHKLVGLPLNDIDQIVKTLLVNGLTVWEVHRLIEQYGTDNMHRLLELIDFSDGLVRSHIIGRIELQCLKIECKPSISVSDIEYVIRERHIYLHPEDRKLLQAVVTSIIKEVPSEALSSAEIMCESDRIFIVFYCGNKEIPTE